MRIDADVTKLFEIARRTYAAVSQGNISWHICEFSACPGRLLDRKDAQELPQCARALEDWAGLETAVSPEMAKTALSAPLSTLGKVSTTFEYLAVSAVRAGTAMDGAVFNRRVETWSLVGELRSPGGSTLPVGMSGRGQGLEVVSDVKWAEEALQRLAFVDAACAAGHGPQRVLLSPQASAVLVHEAIGHFSEASAHPGVTLNHRLGCRIAAECCTFLDDPMHVDAPAQYEYDDEGTRTLGVTEVVREGILVRQMHSVASAMKAGAEPTANARCASACHPPIPRQSNLLGKAGTACEEEMLESLGDGLHIVQLANGFGFGTRVEAAIVLGEIIKSGRRTGKYITGGLVSDSVDCLTRATLLGSRCIFNSNAMCGKNSQVLPDVGTSVPSILMSSLNLKQC